MWYRRKKRKKKKSQKKWTLCSAATSIGSARTLLGPIILIIILKDFESSKFYIIIIPYSESSGIDLTGAAILVMWSCLLPLLSKCTHQGCGAAVNPDNMVTHRNGKIEIYNSFLHFSKLTICPGAALKISLICDDGHCEEWSSSESIKAGRWTVPLINLGIICYSFVCGLHWDQLQVISGGSNCFIHIWTFQAFFSKLGVLSVSTATFYRYLDKVVYPFVWDNWLRNQAESLEEVLVCVIS